MRRTLALAALAFLVSACGDQDPTTPPLQPTDPSRAIVDALNGDEGNPFVFLKPPVVDEPDPSRFRTFDPDLDVVVEVCRLDTTTDPESCDSLLETNDGSGKDATYTLSDGPGGETVTVDLTEEEYQVQIHFDRFDLQQGLTTYRIQTRVGEVILAYADLEMVAPRQMRNAGDGQSIVFTNDRLTVPWKVRIDRGAICFARLGVECTATTVTVGEETTVTYTSSDAEEVDLHLPAGWSATVDGSEVEELTFTIQELLASFGTQDDPSCFRSFELDDPLTGEPSNCYDVQVDTEAEEDVDVVFAAPFPILAFCPDDQVLQAIADGEEGWLMTSIEEDGQGQTTRTYENVQAASDFGGCPLPAPSSQAALETSIGHFASAVWRYVRPLVRPLLPKPLYAADLGFGGELTRLSTIFFWSRTAKDVSVVPNSSTIFEGQDLQFTVEPVFHHGGSDGSFAGTGQWFSSNTSVATVNANGLVTGIEPGTAFISFAATGVEDPDGSVLTDSATVTVTDDVIFSASFDSDTLGQAPSSPEIGTWSFINNDVKVLNGLGDIPSPLAVLTHPGSDGSAPDLAGTVAGIPPSSGTYVARWKLVSNSDPDSAVAGNVVVRDSQNRLIAVIGFTGDSGTDSDGLGEISLNNSTDVGDWVRNTSQSFELEIDLDNQALSLSIDGQLAGSTSFLDTSASDLSRIGVETGSMDPQQFGWDDVAILQPSASIF